MTRAVHPFAEGTATLVLPNGGVYRSRFGLDSCAIGHDVVHAGICAVIIHKVHFYVAGASDAIVCVIGIGAVVGNVPRGCHHVVHAQLQCTGAAASGNIGSNRDGSRRGGR